jgi:hypothetical protein
MSNQELDLLDITRETKNKSLPKEWKDTNDQKMLKCEICNTKLIGNQLKYCSIKCKDRRKAIKHKHSRNERAKNRGAKVKRELVEIFGGKCVRCGYDKNYAALSFHHKDPSKKEMTLCANTLTHTKMDKIKSEASKCELLCMNCHMEEHHPDYNRVEGGANTTLPPPST